MARFSRSRSRRVGPRPARSRSRTFALIGLSLIALATLILVAVALLSRPAPSTVTLPEPTTPSAPAAPSPTPSPTDTVESPPTVRTAVQPMRLLAADAASGALLRAEISACDVPETEAELEVSFDRGSSWNASNLTRIDAAELRQLNLSNSDAQLVYLDEECAPLVAISSSAGAEWAPSDASASAWYLVSPGGPAAITPSGEVELPCSAVALSASTERGVALCADETITLSTDAGASWSEPVAVRGASAVGMDDDGFLVASANEPGCSGVQVRTVEDDVTGEPGQCIEIDAEPGTIAVTGAAGSWFVWAGDSFFRSDDGGASWA